MTALLVGLSCCSFLVFVALLLVRLFFSHFVLFVLGRINFSFILLIYLTKRTAASFVQSTTLLRIKNWIVYLKMSTKTNPIFSVGASCRSGCKRTLWGSLRRMSGPKLFRFEPAGLSSLGRHAGKKYHKLQLKPRITTKSRPADHLTIDKVMGEFAFACLRGCQVPMIDWLSKA